MESIALRKTQPSDNDLNQETNNNMVNDDNLNDIMLIYEWVDSFNLSKAKKNISRDFSDGLLLAEMLKKYVPQLVDLNNYPECHSKKLKQINWETLNNKVLKRIGCKISQNEINDVIDCKSNSIEMLLKKVFDVIQKKYNKTIRDEVENTNKNNVNNYYENLKKKLKGKENAVQELKETISVLENQLNSHLEYNQKLENNITEMLEKLKEKGYEI